MLIYKIYVVWHFGSNIGYSWRALIWTKRNDTHSLTIVNIGTATVTLKKKIIALSCHRTRIKNKSHFWGLKFTQFLFCSKSFSVTKYSENFKRFQKYQFEIKEFYYFLSSEKFLNLVNHSIYWDITQKHEINGWLI